MRGPRSLTARLVVTTVALALLVSVLVAAATTLAMRGYLTDQLDAQVRQSLARTLRGDRPIGPGEGDPRPGPGQEIGTVLGLFPDSGEASASVLREGKDAPVLPEELGSRATTALEDVPPGREVHAVDLPGLGGYRAQARDVPGGTVVVALPTDDIDDALGQLLWWEALLTLLAVVAAAGAALVVVRRQLRPLREVASTAHTVAALPLETGAIDIPERVPERLTDARTEVGQVGAALNTLLARVESSLEVRHRSEQQVRQFVADASHELRSPLATIAGYTELARSRAGDPAVARTALDKVEEESARMTSLVEDLLLLARLDAGRPLGKEPVDLTNLLLEAVSDARVVAPDHRWRLDVPDALVDDPPVVAGDPLRLHQVVTNLLTNARKHTPAGTTVTVAVRRDGFSVHDDGPGFPPDLVDHAFERFARGDAARTRGGEVGVGLGLSLVEAIVRSHGGQVSLRSAPGDTTVDVSLRG